MELIINEDLCDVAIPVWVMKINQHSCVTVLLEDIYMNIWDPLVGKCLFEKQERANLRNG